MRIDICKAIYMTEKQSKTLVVCMVLSFVRAVMQNPFSSVKRLAKLTHHFDAQSASL